MLRAVLRPYKLALRVSKASLYFLRMSGSWQLAK